MDNTQLILLDESFNQEMLSILEGSPVTTNGLSLYFDKTPDIFEISRFKYSESTHLGFFINGSLKGFGSLGYYNALVQGNVEKVFTFYNFYLLPEARGKQIPLQAMKTFFFNAEGKANFGISITMKGNRSAESYIGRKTESWMPATKVIDELVVKSILFAFPKKNETSYTVRNARMADIPTIVQLLNAEHTQRDFGFIFNENTFQSVMQNRQIEIEQYFVAMDRTGSIKGVCLAWDCNSFRRTKVLSFSLKFYPSLLFYKTLEKIFPLAAFPKKGESFRELTLTDYAVMNRDPEIMHALLSEIYRRHHNRKYHFMNWASCGSDPLLKAANGFWYHNINSHIIFTSMDPVFYNREIRLPYVDIAFI